MKLNSASTYFFNIRQAVQTSTKGLFLTLRHLLQSVSSKTSVDIREADYFQKQEGIMTVQYPHETIPVPDVGRYQLHNEIDDCIVCDKCAKICPVNCITIEPLKSTEEFGKTSDGTPKRIYAAKFDIDMSKCCFCGLCTTVCPTECLTMTKNYAFSTYDVKDHTFAYANMTEQEIQEKKDLWEQHQKSKVAAPAKEQPTTAGTGQATPTAPAPTVAKPVFKPRIKPAGL